MTHTRPMTAFLTATALALAPTGAVMAQSGEAQVIVPGSELAQDAPQVHAIVEAMGLYDILQIMSVEQTDAAAQMEADMFPGRGGSAWQAVSASINSAERLIADFDAALPVDTFDAETTRRLTEFFTSDTGQRIAAGEVAARRAFLDPKVEEQAGEIVAEMRAENDPRLDQISRFIEVNNLLERNVSGALNANFAFFQGLSDGDAFTTDMPEELMLAEVWGQEAEIRQSSIDWLFAFLVTAYSDLSDADLDAYIALSETEAGRRLNSALFSAFDHLFETVSYDLGLAAAVFIAGEET